MINLGSGTKHKKGYVNIDYVAPADVILNIAKEKLPFEDGSVDKIEADNFLEHLDNEEFMHVMNECWRVLRPAGIFWFVVPDALRWPDGAFGDPTHKRFFVQRSFNYFTDHPTYHNYGKSYGFKMWRLGDLKSDSHFFTCTLIK